jgi:hypothetical protein
MIVDKYGNYVRKFMWQHCRVDISLTVHGRTILKIVKSTCNGIQKIKFTLMKCYTNVSSTPPTQLPHKFSYIVAILIHNNFESPNTCIKLSWKLPWIVDIITKYKITHYQYLILHNREFSFENRKNYLKSTTTTLQGSDVYLWLRYIIVNCNNLFICFITMGLKIKWV